MPTALPRPCPSNQQRVNSLPMYSRNHDYYDWKPQVDTKTISRPTAACCIILSRTRSHPEDPELKCQGLRHSVGFYCQTHALGSPIRVCCLVGAALKRFENARAPSEKAMTSEGRKVSAFGTLVCRNLKNPPESLIPAFFRGRYLEPHRPGFLRLPERVFHHVPHCLPDMNETGIRYRHSPSDEAPVPKGLHSVLS
jgi:hypothetical protein